MDSYVTDRLDKIIELLAPISELAAMQVEAAKRVPINLLDLFSDEDDDEDEDDG